MSFSRSNFVLRLLVLASLLALALPAMADDKPASAAASELMRSVLPKDAYETMLEQMYSQMSMAMQQSGGEPMTPEKQESLKAAVKECIPYEDVLAWNSEIYGKHFTTKEIKDLSAFYRTATGKKLAKVFPTITSEVMAKMMPTIMSRMPAALKKHGLQ